MGIIIGWIVVVAFLTGGVYSTAQRVTGAGRQALDRIRSHNSTRSKHHKKGEKIRKANAPERAARATGAGIGGLFQASLLALRAGRAGWGVGWSYGRNRVDDWWEKRWPQYTPPPAESVAEPNKTAPRKAPPAPKPVPQPNPTNADNTTRVLPELADTRPSDTPSEPAPSNVIPLRPTNTPEEKTVALLETNGEVANIPQALEKVKALVAEAQAEFEDAQADKVRAEKIKTRDETFGAGFAALEIPKMGKDMVANLVETTTPRAEAATKRAAAADARVSQLKAIQAYLQRHVELGQMAESLGGLAAASAYRS